jgi:voltage-dependent potassium channel beta subunit
VEYRRLGRSGLQVSALSYGAWLTFNNQMALPAVQEMLAICIENGVNFFDNAEGYANGEAELLMGQAFKNLGTSRDSYVVSSKVFFGAAKKPTPTQKGLSRKHIVDACHQALTRLQVDYLDLYFCHRPDPTVPIAEIVWTMHQLIQQGKILYWGSSEWPAELISEAAEFAKVHHLIGPTMEQPQYNLLHRERVEREYAPLYQSIGLGTTIWSPLASGLLTNKYANGMPDDSRLKLPGMEWLHAFVLGEDGGKRKFSLIQRLIPVAESLGLSLAQMSLAWCLKNPNVSTVILGASSPEQLKQNMQALSHVPKLNSAAMAKIEAAMIGL